MSDSKYEMVAFRVMAEQKVRYQGRAEACGLTLSSWLRKLADLDCAGSPPKGKLLSRGDIKWLMQKLSVGWGRTMGGK